MEYRLKDDDYPSTFEFHEHRPRANHLSQGQHSKRLKTAAKFALSVNPSSVVDLGCGDGGLLHLLKAAVPSWGYDFCPANSEGWVERGVSASHLDVFNDRHVPLWGELVVVTEVMEHLADPHGVVEWIAKNARYVVASSPWGETDENAVDNDCHIWGWDIQGYKDLFSPHFTIKKHTKIDWSQVLLAESRYEQSIGNW